MANEELKRLVLRPGGVVEPGDVALPRTGGWRTVQKPAVDLSLCVDCLLCWMHCPDTAIRQHGGVFVGFDYDLCKACEICVEVCPTDAIRMVAEDSDLKPGGVLPGTGGVAVG